MKKEEAATPSKAAPAKDAVASAKPAGGKENPSRETPKEAAKGEREIEDLRSRVKELEAERDRLRAEVGDGRDRYLRARADYDNLAKRAAKEAQESVRFAKSALLLRVATLLETLESAARDAERRWGQEARGVRLVADEAHRLLRDEGVKEIGAPGQSFNVKLHLAVESVATNEHPEGTIVEVVQRGYQFGDEVLKPALVKVAVPAKAQAAPDAAKA